MLGQMIFFRNILCVQNMRSEYSELNCYLYLQWSQFRSCCLLSRWVWVGKVWPIISVFSIIWSFPGAEVVCTTSAIQKPVPAVWRLKPEVNETHTSGNLLTLIVTSRCLVIWPCNIYAQYKTDTKCKQFNDPSSFLLFCVMCTKQNKGN